MNKTWILWAVCIAMYIFNIVLIAITGADLVNNIVAWSMCIMLAITIIIINKSSDLDRETLVMCLDNFPKMRKVQTLMKLHEIAEKLQGNEEATKIIFEEIEKLEKELQEGEND